MKRALRPAGIVPPRTPLVCIPLLTAAAALAATWFAATWFTAASFAAEERSVTTPPEAPKTPLRTVLDFGAIGDGKTDDAAAIQRAVDARTGDIRLPRGVYRISRTITIDLDKVGPTSVIGDGTARIVMAGSGPALKFIGTHDGTADPHTVKPNVWRRQRMPCVDGVEIVGAHAKAIGIEAVGTMQLVVRRVAVRRALHGLHLTRRNRNVIVSDCHLYENRGVGLFLDDVNLHQINVTGSHISYNGAGGIVVRAGNVRNLHVTGCDIEGNMAADGPPTANVLIDGTGGEAGTAEVAITGCTIQHTLRAPDSANVRFIGGDANGRTWGHLTITGNVFSDVQINVDMHNARGVTLVGNTLWTAAKHALRVEGSSHVVIGPNNMDRNPNYRDQETANDGVLLRNCRDCTISGLHVSGTRRRPAGIVLEDCRRINLTGCTILDCDHAGLLLKNVTASRVSNCLIDNERSDENASAWKPLIVEGGSGNCIEVESGRAGD